MLCKFYCFKFINVFAILELRNEKCLSLLRIEMKFYKTSPVEQIAQNFNLIFVCFKLFLKINDFCIESIGCCATLFIEKFIEI
jgi:hypothetical protein